jgi:hypothetical protein
VEELIEQGMKPDEIMDKSITYRRYERLIRDAYFRKRSKETDREREITVYWHVGNSGTGKSREMITLMEEHGDDEVYLVTDYVNGFDKYNGEKIIFMDEFRSQIRYTELLNILDRYKSQIKCRYTNVISLWNEVHITSILPPERAYKKMVGEDRDLDSIEQLKRRIHYVVYHYKEDGDYKKEKIPMSEYSDYTSIMSEYSKEKYEELQQFEIPF